MAVSSSPHHYENLPPPHRLIFMKWRREEVREACEKSRAALDVLNLHSYLIQASNVQNLFLIMCNNRRFYDYVDYWHTGEEGEEEEGRREWGSRDMMLDLGCATPEQRLEYLRAAANFSGGAVHLIRLDELTEEEKKGWVEALSDAADRDATPRNLLIKGIGFDPYETLSALKKSKALTHLSLQECHMSDECVEVLSHFPSLTSLHLHFHFSDTSTYNFLAKLADLHPSHSLLAASLHKLYIFSPSIRWSGRITGFLQHWPQLKDLTLHAVNKINHEGIINWMEQLTPSSLKKKSSETAGSTPAPSADPPRLYSLSLGGLLHPTPSVIAAIIDALSGSGLPFFELKIPDQERDFVETLNPELRMRFKTIMDPAIDEQLVRNRRMFMLRDLERVPAKSMRLFICGDAYAGKTTLLSTMHSIYARQRKRDKLKGLLTGRGRLSETMDRTEGIEVRAIQNYTTQLSLWDMAGQEEFHAFHDCMLPDIASNSYQAPSLFMFVWSPRKSQNSTAGPEEKTVQDFEASFRYWLKFLASKSRKSKIPLKVIVVFTRADQMKLIASVMSDTIGSLRCEFEGVIQIEDATFEVDARKRGSVKRLSQHIFGIAEQMLEGVMVYDICREVGQHLSTHLETSNQRIITWSKFTEICKPIIPPILNEEEAKIIRGIASSLNESGIIIYVNNVSHIVLDPNWFCNKIMGSLIHFRDRKEKLNTIKVNGFTNRRFLEDTLELVTKDEVKGSLLVDLMEAMHLCCKVPDNNEKSTKNMDRLFIPTTLTLDPVGKGLFVGMDRRLKWRTSNASTLDCCNPYVYIGRRLECENANLTFLTPGLFPRIQVVFMLENLERIPAKSMRLFICGDAYAGKTTLLSTMHSINAGPSKLRRLLNSGATLIQRDRTKGIEVRTIKNDRIRLSLWDMAGQEEFHAFHDCMLPDIASSSYRAPSLFMFVWSPRKSQNSRAGPEEKTEQEFEVSFRYWLKFLASKTRKSKTPLKVIVVFTRADQMKLIASAVSNTIGSLRSEFKEIIHIEDTTFEVDARKMDSVRGLFEHIFGIAEQMLEGVMVYDICTEVGQHLSKHLETSNQRIITWSKFREICKPILRPNLNEDETKILRGIASSLNESGIIIYVNNISHIVLDPNWFCNKIMGSLIHFRDRKDKLNTMKINGFTNRRFLEDTLELVTNDKVKGSLLVDLMEAMHLCCKVPDNHEKSTRNKDRLFIPTTLPLDSIDGGLFGGMDQRLKWRTSNTSTLDGCDAHVYMGRRLDCENANLTFLTPGLFPKIQAVFNNTFQEEGNAYINLGKDFISIYVRNMEIIVVFCKAKSDHVIDVLVRATISNTQQTYLEGNFDYVEENIINYLIKICAQPTGIQGVKLIESVIRPDSFDDPSNVEYREDQCVKVSTLKEKLRRQIQQGEQECHVWKKTKYMDTCTTNSFIDILGSKNYSEVIMSCKAWLEEVRDVLLEMDDVNGYKQHESHCSVSMTNLEYSQDLEMQEDEYCKRTVTEITRALEPKFNSVKRMVAANHQRILSMRKKLDEVHSDLKYMREDVLSKVEKAADKLLKFVMESEAEKQLPHFVILTSDGVNNIRKLVTKVSGGHVSSIRLQLCCEDRMSPHPVENQRGITITSLSEPLKTRLERALPYVNGLLWMLTIAAKLGINSVFPMTGAFLQDLSLAQLKLPKKYPLPAPSSSNSHVRPTILQSSKEWQKCFESILNNKYGGVTNEIIYDKFHLKRATYKESSSNIHVAWLCDKHYREQTPFPLD